MIEYESKIDSKVKCVGYAFNIGGTPVILGQQEMFDLLRKLCGFLGLEFVEQKISENEVN